MSSPTADQQALTTKFRAQQGLCRELGSDLYVNVLEACIADIERGGPVWSVTQGIAQLPERAYPALRLLGSVHRLVLTGRADRLAAHYPSAGGSPGPELCNDFLDTVHEHAATLIPMVAQTPQTNEVGRSATLLGGYLEIGRMTGLPLRVLEIGASAGLNLAWDRYRYESGDWSWGDPGSPVRITDIFTGETPEPADVTVVERRGCDLGPLDLQSEDGLVTLLSYVWPDQVARIDRLRAAAQVVGELDPPVQIDTADAVEWLRQALATPVEGTATVVTHSIVTSYFDDATAQAFEDVLAEAGARSSENAPIAELSLEAAGGDFPLTLRTWPGDTSRVLAYAGGHGLPVRWNS